MAAIRITATVAGERLAVETWYVDPGLEATGSAGLIHVDLQPTADTATPDRTMPAQRTAGGDVFVPSPVDGVDAIVLRGADPDSTADVVVGLADREHTNLVAAYDAVLGRQPSQPSPGADADLSTRDFAVSTREDVVTRLSGEGFTEIAVVGTLQPVRLQVTYGLHNGSYAKTTYREDDGGLVTLVQTANPYLPAEGKAVPIRGTVAKSHGDSLYWQENGWVLAVTTEAGDEPAAIADLLRWQQPQP